MAAELLQRCVTAFLSILSFPLFFSPSPFSFFLAYEPWSLSCRPTSRTAMRAHGLDISMRGESRALRSEGYILLSLNAPEDRFCLQSGSTRIAVNRLDSHPPRSIVPPLIKSAIPPYLWRPPAECRDAA